MMMDQVAGESRDGRQLNPWRADSLIQRKYMLIITLGEDILPSLVSWSSRLLRFCLGPTQQHCRFALCKQVFLTFCMNACMNIIKVIYAFSRDSDYVELVSCEVRWWGAARMASANCEQDTRPTMALYTLWVCSTGDIHVTTITIIAADDNANNELTNLKAYNNSVDGCAWFMKKHFFDVR